MISSPVYKTGNHIKNIWISIHRRLLLSRISILLTVTSIASLLPVWIYLCVNTPLTIRSMLLYPYCLGKKEHQTINAILLSCNLPLQSLTCLFPYLFSLFFLTYNCTFLLNMRLETFPVRVPSKWRGGN